MSRFPWLDIAVSLIGTKEIPGKKNNPKILEMYPEAGDSKITSENVPWCSAFVCYCLSKAGYRDTDSLLARSYLKYGVACDPQKGAIAIFPRGNDPTFGHVGIVDDYHEATDTVWLVSGNEGDAVKRSPYPRKKALGFRMPRPQDRIKPVAKSKIATGSATIATTGGADVGIQINDAIDTATRAKDAADTFGLWSIAQRTLETLATNPRFWVGLGFVVVGGAIIYWRWRDHGRGATQ